MIIRTIFLILTFVIFSLSARSFENSKKYRDVFFDLQNEIQNAIFPQIDDTYSFPIDSVDKFNNRKRLFYWLNLKNSKLAKVKINNRDLIVAKNFNKNKNKVFKINAPIRSLSGVSSTKRSSPSSLTLKALASFNLSESEFSTSRVENMEYSNYSEPTKTLFTSILGLKRKIDKDMELDFNIFINRNNEEEIRLKEFSGLFQYNINLENDFVVVPFISLFIPVRQQQENLNNQEKNAIVANPGLALKSYFIGFGDIQYNLSYYYNTQTNSKNTFLNSIKYHNNFKNLNFLAGFNGVNRKGFVKTSKFITLYYSLLTKYSREFKLAFTTENKLISFSDPLYTFGISYNF